MPSINADDLRSVLIESVIRGSGTVIGAGSVVVVVVGGTVVDVDVVVVTSSMAIVAGGW
jgi:hypothetical protein